MKCVVGVDLERRSPSVIGLLGRLSFAIDETILLHVTEPMQLTMPFSAYGMFAETDSAYETLTQSGKMVLAEAHIDADLLGLHSKTSMCDGYPVTSLCQCADQIGAALIAVTSTTKGVIGAIFGGSVARGLAISARQSVLVARDDPLPDEPLRVVFASDQSSYCDRCSKLLVQFAPKGISHMTLLTVQELPKHERHLSLPSSSGHNALARDPPAQIEAKSLETAKWFTRNGIPTDSRVVMGNVDEGIHKVMSETRADLLIMGSQGHGLVNRMLVGSTSLHEIVGERYPVLLLRC